ncbi:MAG: hypothetical protein AB7F23_06195 [Phycisphaerae bacterium]
MIRRSVLFAVLLCATLFAALSSTMIETRRKMRTINSERLFTASITGETIPPVISIFSMIRKNTDIPRARKLARERFDSTLGNVQWVNDASAGRFEQELDWWLRIYYTCAKGNTGVSLPSELTEDILSVFYNYASVASVSSEITGEKIWSVEGNSASVIARWARVYLCLDAIDQLPAYRAIILGDGNNIEYHMVLWSEFWKLFCLEHCKNGLFPEVFSDAEGRRLIIALINLYDFGSDRELHRRLDTLMSLLWADWAQLEYNGVRAGVRTGVTISEDGRIFDQDSWRFLTIPFISNDADWIVPESYKTLDDFDIYVMADTTYKMPDSVMVITLDSKPRVPYVSKCSYPAQVRENASGIRFIDPLGKRLVSYSFNTNYYSQSSLVTAPLVKPLPEYEQHLDPNSEYFAELACKDIFQGIVFANSKGTVFYPACYNNGQQIRDYNSLLCAQHKNIALYYPNPETAPNGFVEFGLTSSFGSSYKESDGWYIWEIGNVWIGVRGYSIQNPQQYQKIRWLDRTRFVFDDETAPAVMVTSLGYQCKNIDEFIEYLAGQFVVIKDGTFTLYGTDSEKGPAKISINTASAEMPVINGETMKVKTDYIYDGPILSSKLGSGVYSIDKDGKKMVVDVVNNIISEN